MLKEQLTHERKVAVAAVLGSVYGKPKDINQELENLLKSLRNK